MPTDRVTVAEPTLTVWHRPKFFRRKRFLFSFPPAAVIAVGGLLSLLLSGNLVVPFEPVIILEGKIASKAEFFEDEQVQEILMRHHIRVHLTQTGSREIATHDLDQYDFAMPSGQPAADLIVQTRPGVRVYRPFITPIVLATYREYADTLVDAGIATRQNGGLYYTLNTTEFLNAVEGRQTWDGLGIKDHGGGTNGNKVLAQTSDVCLSNSGGTYLGVVAFIKNNNSTPQNDQEADELATRIKPILTGQGLPAADMFGPYTGPEGRGTAPIIVVYEHQYLAYQLQYQTKFGKPDSDRVLLYPAARFQTQPVMISLKPVADQLGELITRDSELRERAVALGFRVLDAPGVTATGQLSDFLQQHGLPAPSMTGDDTKTYLPRLSLLERMIKIVGDCA